MQTTLQAGAGLRPAITISTASIARYVAAMLDQQAPLLVCDEQRKKTRQAIRQEARVYNGH